MPNRHSETCNRSAPKIAGILNDKRDGLFLIPHPERVVKQVHGNTHGRRQCKGLLSALS